MKLIPSFLMVFLAIGVDVSNAQSSAAHKPTLKLQRRMVPQIDVAAGPIFSAPIRSKNPGRDRAVLPGFAASLRLNQVFTTWVSLSFLMSYEQKGFKDIYHRTNTDVTPTRNEKVILIGKLNYFTAALLAKFTPIESLPINFGIGPYGGYVLKARGIYEIYSSGQLINKGGAIPKPRDFIDYDFGITSCIGYKMKLRPSFGVLFELRYSRGLITINKPTQGELTNNTFSAVVGISLIK